MFAYQSAPNFYSQFGSHQIESPRDKYLRALTEAQAAKDNYLQFLAAEKERELFYQRQAHQRRAHELELLSGLSRAQVGFPTGEYSFESPLEYRDLSDRPHFPGHPHFQGWERGSTRVPGHFPDTFTPHRRLRATRRCLPSQIQSGEKHTGMPGHSDSSKISQLEELLSVLLGGQVMQSRKEPEVTDQKTSSTQFSPCRARPLNLHCPQRSSGTLTQPPSCPTTLDHGNSTQIPQRCQYRHFRPTGCGIPQRNEGAVPSSSSHQQDSKKDTPLPAAPSVEGIKEELERRLYTNPDIEIRDTVNALLASLSGSSPVKPSEPAPSQSGDAKGKAKEAPFSDSTAGPTAVDITASLNALRDIETSFNTLESEFVFPAHLDFDTTPSSPTPSVHSDSSTLSSVLTYTSTNAPVRYYENALSSLLSQLDSVESFGSEEVRTRRKVLVARVESALEEVEREVNGRLEAQRRKEAAMNSERVQAADDSTPSEPSQHETTLESPQAQPEEASELSTTSAEHVDHPTLITLERPLSNPPSILTLPPHDLSLPNRKRSDIATSTNQPLAESVSSDPPAIDETESLADSTDSTLTIQPPSVEKTDDQEQGPPHSSIESGPEQVDTFLLPATSTEPQAPSPSSNAITNSDDELFLVDTVSDGGWSEVASDA